MGRFVAGLLCGLLVAALALAAASLLATDLSGDVAVTSPPVPALDPAAPDGDVGVIVAPAPSSEAPAPLPGADPAAPDGPEIIEQTVPVLPPASETDTEEPPAGAGN